MGVCTNSSWLILLEEQDPEGLLLLLGFGEVCPYV
jgi:hypothetical protein